MINRPKPGDYYAIELAEDGTTISFMITDHGCMFTLPDGTALNATAHDTAEYRARAAMLGYPSGIAMAQEHDLLHARLCAALELGPSPTLMNYAAKQPSNEITDAEEAMVLAAARFLNLVRQRLGAA